MVEHGQATVEGLAIAVAIAALLAALALGIGSSAGAFGAAVAGALEHALPGPARGSSDDALSDAERRLADAVERGGGGDDAPDVADLADLLDARLGAVVGPLVLARTARELVAAAPVPPCVIPGIYGSSETYAPDPGSSPSIHVTTRAEQDRWVRDALAKHPLAELAKSGAGLIPGFAPAVAFADIAEALPQDAPADGIEPGHRAGDIVVGQPVAGGVNAARETVRVRVLRSSAGNALRSVRDAVVQRIFPRWTHPCT